MHYIITDRFIPQARPASKEKVLHILTEEELDQLTLPAGLEPEEIRVSRHSRFCKAESHTDYLLGTIRLPLSQKRGGPCTLVYAIWEDHLLFLDDHSPVQTWCEQIRSKNSWNHPGLGRIFHDFLSLMIADDLRYLEDLEQQITALEAQVLTGKLEHFNQRLVRHRKVIMNLTHYYSQMADMMDELLQNRNHFFTQEELQLFDLLGNRLLRLKDEAYLLREYAIQTREVYQAQLDLRQNSIMQTLTIVTTIFLPLSLIAGWYGMNFTHMPELTWKYGYLAVAIVSVTVVAFCVWLFKKKKFW